MSIKVIDLSDLPKDAIAQQAEMVDLGRAIFKDRHPALVSAALAELLAILLAGHQVERETHEELLQAHMQVVRELLPLVEDEMNKQMQDGKPPQ